MGISWLTVEPLASEDDVPFMEIGFWLLGWVGLVNLV